MTRGAARPRSGITLIEILISILILGVGVISIATLFPLGLIRLRNAQRLTRGAYLVESATADLGARNLLSQFSFYRNPFSGPWYQTAASGFYNPLYVDTSAPGADWGGFPIANTVPPPNFVVPPGANRFNPNTGNLVGAGLPIAYDPLWRCVTGVYTDPTSAAGFEARFGGGTAFVRGESASVPGHAHGLPRLSNFQASYPFVTSGATFNMKSATTQQIQQNTLAVLSTFVSPEDLVLQDVKGQYADPNNTANSTVSPSPLVPDMTTGTPVSDWRYSWFFTGQQTDPSSTDVTGEIVVCENRPFGVDTVPTPGGAAGSTTNQVSGETVVEAVWNNSSSPGQMLPLAAGGVSTTQGYGSLSGSRSVLLRWSTAVPDPDVRVGGWIADVTYERVQATVAGNATASGHYLVNPITGAINGLFPAQRCYWYQVAKKSAPADDSVAGFRSMTVWTTTPLRAMTLLTFTSGKAAAPAHYEAALIMPSVINVYPRTVYTR